jgi:hypothetical protein
LPVWTARTIVAIIRHSASGKNSTAFCRESIRPTVRIRTIVIRRRSRADSAAIPCRTCSIRGSSSSRVSLAKIE